MSSIPKFVHLILEKAEELAQDHFVQSADEERRAFLERYHPDRLRGLRGVELLERLCGTGEDPSFGMFYQLEFGKTKSWGGIGGGSAVKFEVYRGQDGAWKKRGQGNVGVSCTEGEAAQLAEQLVHRVLLPGCDGAKQLAVDPGHKEAWQTFSELSKSLPRLHPGNQPLLERGWAHKYLCLLLPDVFSFHHNPSQLRNHLIRLLIDPEETRWLLDHQWRIWRSSSDELRHISPQILGEALYSVWPGWPRYWQMDPPSSEAASVKALAHADRLRASGRLQITETRRGLRVTAGRWVGTVQLEDVQLVIEPRLAPSATATLLRYAYRLGRRSVPRVASPATEAGFLELIAELMLEETDVLLQRGLFQDYRPREELLVSPRGKIQLPGPALPGRVGLVCVHAPRTHDVPLNRALAGCLADLASGLRLPWLALELHQRERILSELCSAPRNLTGSLLKEAFASLDRRSEYYRPALELADLIHRSLSFGFSQGSVAPMGEFLFDMSRLFERTLERLCIDHCPAGFTVAPQERHYRAFRYQRNPAGWRRPSLRPDLLVRDRSGKTRLVLDAKYKDLDRSEFGMRDLCQMTLYSLAYDHAPARIVYPASGVREQTSLRFFFPDGSCQATVLFQGIDLGELARAIERGQQRDFARALLDDSTHPPRVEMLNSR
ncbi:hypothetical protein DYH09_04695 [bacterium CPR1]|nr:hypothetical protein [bacterium CPR1]